ncbi:MAG: hypothetical protein R2794_07490 [Chitinophagales bacterium]
MYIEHHLQENIPAHRQALRRSVLRTLAYFDIWHYPLTFNELVRFCDTPVHDGHALHAVIKELEEDLVIFREGSLYSITNDESCFIKRKHGNDKAAEMMPKAARRAQFIHRFPFVRSVNISGSMSKNYYDETTDFDFFIVTAPDRLWICKLLLTAYKKLFLFNNRKYFCINYYVDTNGLQIPDKNIFSAMEVCTLKNITGADIFKQFIQENKWTSDYYPNNAFYPSEMPTRKDPVFKNCMEWLLGGSFGNKVDTLAFRITTYFLRKKYRTLQPEAYALNMRSKKDVSKHHPQGFQTKVLRAFQDKCTSLEARTGISIA